MAEGTSVTSCQFIFTAVRSGILVRLGEVRLLDRDGDVIAFLRGCGYVHAGVEVVVDASAQTPGYVVVDPTPVEKKLRLGCGKSVGAHKLAAYRKGLWGAAGCRGDPPARRARLSESPAPPPPAEHTVSCCWRTSVDVDATPLI